MVVLFDTYVRPEPRPSLRFSYFPPINHARRHAKYYGKLGPLSFGCPDLPSNLNTREYELVDFSVNNFKRTTALCRLNTPDVALVCPLNASSILSLS